MENGNSFVVLHKKTLFTPTREIMKVYGPFSKRDAEMLAEKLRKRETTIFCSVAVGSVFLSGLTDRAKESLEETICRI